MRKLIFQSLPVLLSLLFGPMLPCGNAAQGPQGIVVQNFKLPLEFYPPPHERQAKYFLQGVSAQPDSGGRYRVTEIKLQTFRTNGEVEMTIVAPQCWYDQQGKVVQSPGRLRMESGDGKFAITGEGFALQQTNSVLVISNNVQTVLQAEVMAKSKQPGPPKPAGTEPIRIDARQFVYRRESGDGTYSGNVLVTGPTLKLTCEMLTAQVPWGEGQVRSILAERNVHVNYEEWEASGERGLYSADTEILDVTGNAKWRYGKDRSGSADRITIRRGEAIADGNAVLRLAGQAAAVGGLLESSPEVEGKTPAIERVTEVRCGQYTLQTNLAAFRKDVVVRSFEAGAPKGMMTCGQMDLSFVGTNQLQTLTAEQKVKIEQFKSESTNRFLAEHALFTATNSVLDLTGNPSWSSGLRDGRGERISVDLRNRRMWVRENAFMRLPTSELGRADLPLAAGQKHPAPALATEAPAELHCDEYTVSESDAVFSGRVRITHPQLMWECPRLTVEFPPKGSINQKMTAEAGVTFRVVKQDGQSVQGAGDRAVLRRWVESGKTNAVMELTGAPATLRMNDGTQVRNRLLILDAVTGRLSARGISYRVMGPPGSVDTNVFNLGPKELSQGALKKKK